MILLSFIGLCENGIRRLPVSILYYTIAKKSRGNFHFFRYFLVFFDFLRNYEGFLDKFLGKMLGVPEPDHIRKSIEGEVGIAFRVDEVGILVEQRQEGAAVKNTLFCRAI